MTPQRPIAMSYTVSYSVHEVVTTAGQAMRAMVPIKGGVIVREAISRTDAAAQALRDLADAGLVMGRYEEIRIEVKDN